MNRRQFISSTAAAATLAAVATAAQAHDHHDHAAHGSHVSAPEEAQPGSVPPRGGYGIQAQPGYGTPPGAPQGPYGA